MRRLFWFFLVLAMPLTATAASVGRKSAAPSAANYLRIGLCPTMMVWNVHYAFARRIMTGDRGSPMRTDFENPILDRAPTAREIGVPFRQ
jgi:hypothetical protein